MEDIRQSSQWQSPGDAEQEGERFLKNFVEFYEKVDTANNNAGDAPSFDETVQELLAEYRPHLIAYYKSQPPPSSKDKEGECLGYDECDLCPAEEDGECAFGYPLHREVDGQPPPSSKDKEGESEEKKEKCPDCGSNATTLIDAINAKYHCKGCGHDFFSWTVKEPNSQQPPAQAAPPEPVREGEEPQEGKEKEE